MVLDVCPPLPSPPDVVRLAVERTAAWAARARASPRAPRPGAVRHRAGRRERGDAGRERATHGRARLRRLRHRRVVGGRDPRTRCCRPSPPRSPHLPADRPRYLMGVGDPASMVEAVGLGVDQFDCVMQTRLGRHGTALTGDRAVERQAATSSRSATSRSTPRARCWVCRAPQPRVPPTPVQGRRADRIAPGQRAQRGLDDRPDGPHAGGDRRPARSRRCGPNPRDLGLTGIAAASIAIASLGLHRPLCTYSRILAPTTMAAVGGSSLAARPAAHPVFGDVLLADPAAAQADAGSGVAAVVARRRRRGHHELGHLRLHHRVEDDKPSGSRSTTTCRSGSPRRRSRARSTRGGADATPATPTTASAVGEVDDATRDRTRREDARGSGPRSSASSGIARPGCSAEPRHRQHAGARSRPPGRALGHLRHEPSRPTQDDLIVVRDLIRDQLESLGIAEPDVRVEGENIIVDLPGVSDQAAGVRAPQVSGIVSSARDPVPGGSHHADSIVPTAPTVSSGRRIRRRPSSSDESVGSARRRAHRHGGRRPAAPRPAPPAPLHAEPVARPRATPTTDPDTTTGRPTPSDDAHRCPTTAPPCRPDAAAAPPSHRARRDRRPTRPARTSCCQPRPRPVVPRRAGRRHRRGLRAGQRRSAASTSSTGQWVVDVDLRPDGQAAGTRSPQQCYSGDGRSARASSWRSCSTTSSSRRRSVQTSRTSAATCRSPATSTSPRSARWPGCSTAVPSRSASSSSASRPCRPPPARTRSTPP